ncbi:MAG: signal peptidase I [Firmicutes bacterium]|nr:signal peptidase I [Bacillota bacterium]
MKKIVRIVVVILLLTGLLFAGVAFARNFSSGGGITAYTLFHVTGGSMEPTVSLGSLAVVKRVGADELAAGDIITYYSREYGSITTHRIIEVNPDFDNTGRTGYRTQGDANATPDKKTIFSEDVVGRVIKVIPAVGKAVHFFQANFIWVAGAFLTIGTLALSRK